MTQLTFAQVAKICHQANKALCENNGDFSQVDWENASDAIKESEVAGVEYAAGRIIGGNPTSPSAQHAAWKKFKIEQGYVYGPVKDDEKKTHPCIVDYDQLPEIQRKKDELFLSIVETFF